MKDKSFSQTSAVQPTISLYILKKKERRRRRIKGGGGGEAEEGEGNKKKRRRAVLQFCYSFLPVTTKVFNT